jgi:AcrR family transcriptional regulator
MAASTKSRPVRPYGGVSAEQRVHDRRERLLEAALDEFGTRGFASTGVKDVCRRAGLTDRYFYESFKDSRALFIAVFDRATERLLGSVATAVERASPEPEPQARAAIDAYVRELAEDERLARVVLTEAAAAGPEAERHMRVTLRRMAGLVEATAAPHLPPGFPRKVLRLGAVSVVGAVDRLVVEWHDGQLGASVDEVVDYAVGMFLALGASIGVSKGQG